MADTHGPPPKMPLVKPSNHAMTVLSDTEKEAYNTPPEDGSSSTSTKAGSEPREKSGETNVVAVNKVSGDESTDAVHEKAPEYPGGISLFFILLALFLSIFLASLDMTIVATAIPKITDEFHGLTDVSWYGSVYFMTNGGFQSTWGKVYKYFPAKLTFMASIFVFMLGSLICAVAPNSTTLIVGRAITGLGASGIGTGSYTIIAFVASPAKRPMFTGIVGISYGIAAVIGPLIGGIFADKVTWRWCFYINLPIGGIAAAIIFFFHTSNAAKPVSATWKEKFLNMDLVGTSLIMAAIVSYILALQYGGQTKPGSSSVVIGLLVGFIVLVAIFSAWEGWLDDRAIVLPRLLKRRAVGVNCTFIFFFAGAYFLIIYYLPIYFQSVDNTSPIMSGVRNLPLIVSVTISMIASGIYISNSGHAIPLQFGGAAIAIVGAGLIYTLDANSGAGKWIGYQIVAGLGWGLAYQVAIIIAQASSDVTDMSSVTAMILFFQGLGGTTFVSAAQAAFVNKLISSLPTNVPNVDPAKVIATGATEIRSAFTANEIPGIVLSYMSGIKAAFAIAIAGAGVALFASASNRWERLQPSQELRSSEAAV